MDLPLYTTSPRSALSDLGSNAYQMFNQAVVLDQVKRQAGQDPSQVLFRNILIRLRNGETTESDWKHLMTRTLVMYTRLRFLIKWPSREVVRKNMPNSFKLLYPRCVCIIDCSEIFIETPVYFEAISKTYSNYKKHNTIKFLIGITPNGSISFLSKCWGGRVSDKVITQDSKFFNHILPGDVILADRGFTLCDDFAVYGAKLEIPVFTRGKTQLLQNDVESSKNYLMYVYILNV